MHLITPVKLARAGGISPHRYTFEEILQEISYFEARLETVGQDGDCGYERALAEMYHALIKQRRDMLGRITRPSTC